MLTRTVGACGSPTSDGSMTIYLQGQLNEMANWVKSTNPILLEVIRLDLPSFDITGHDQTYGDVIYFTWDCNEGRSATGWVNMFGALNSQQTPTGVVKQGKGKAYAGRLVRENTGGQTTSDKVASYPASWRWESESPLLLYDANCSMGITFYSYVNNLSASSGSDPLYSLVELPLSFVNVTLRATIDNSMTKGNF